MATDNTDIFISDERSLTGDAFKTLNVLLVVCGAALGFGGLEKYPGMLIAISLIFLILAHLFLFLRARFVVDCVRYENAFKWAPEQHPVHRLTDAYDNSSGIAGAITTILSLVAVMFLCVGMIDQFTTIAVLPSVSDAVVVIMLTLIVLLSLGAWTWLFFRLGETLDDFSSALPPSPPTRRTHGPTPPAGEGGGAL